MGLAAWIKIKCNVIRLDKCHTLQKLYTVDQWQSKHTADNNVHLQCCGAPAPKEDSNLCVWSPLMSATPECVAFRWCISDVVLLLAEDRCLVQSRQSTLPMLTLSLSSQMEDLFAHYEAMTYEIVDNIRIQVTHYGERLWSLRLRLLCNTAKMIITCRWIIPFPNNTLTTKYFLTSTRLWLKNNLKLCPRVRLLRRNVKKCSIL